MSDPDRPIVSHAAPAEVKARQKLQELFEKSPIPGPELILNLGLYTRSTLVAKLLYLNELYQQVLQVPGVIMEFGVWWGANLSLLTGLRSALEPYNWNRRVIGFDTFTGYSPPAAEDGRSPYLKEGAYRVSEGYRQHLESVLAAHEEDNVLGHLRKFELVEGNVLETIEPYFRDHPETIIALAYLDLALYEPTRHVLQAILPRMPKGAVLAMDELGSREFPGETLAYQEIVGVNRLRLVKSRFLPDRTYAIVE